MKPISLAVTVTFCCLATTICAEDSPKFNSLSVNEAIAAVVAMHGDMSLAVN